MFVLVDTNQSDVWWFTCRYRNVCHMDDKHYSLVHFGFAHRNWNLFYLKYNLHLDLKCNNNGFRWGEWARPTCGDGDRRWSSEHGWCSRSAERHRSCQQLQPCPSEELLGYVIDITSEYRKSRPRAAPSWPKLRCYWLNSTTVPGKEGTVEKSRLLTKYYYSPPLCST